MGKTTSGFQLYRNQAGQWRWRIVAWNGRIVADCGEGCRRRASVVNSARAARRFDAPGERCRAVVAGSP
jgi:uncharacterized protein YegP (UPF0339 family)